jgi:hypothetical protein
MQICLLRGAESMNEQLREKKKKELKRQSQHDKSKKKTFTTWAQPGIEPGTSHNFFPSLLEEGGFFTRSANHTARPLSQIMI